MITDSDRVEELVAEFFTRNTGLHIGDALVVGLLTSAIIMAAYGQSSLTHEDQSTLLHHLLDLSLDIASEAAAELTSKFSGGDPTTVH